MIFATDIDLLHWEPNLLCEARLVSQRLITGLGTLRGRSFVLTAGSMAAAHVTPGQAILLRGRISGCFAIDSIESAQSLTLQQVNDPLDESAAPTVAGFVIRTFRPQRQIVSELLMQAAGVDDGEAILNRAALRRPCVLGTLHLVYSALAAASGTQSAIFDVRAELYQRLYRRALRSTHLEIDTNHDGEPDTRRMLDLAPTEQPQ